MFFLPSAAAARAAARQPPFLRFHGPLPCLTILRSIALSYAFTVHCLVLVLRFHSPQKKERRIGGIRTADLPHLGRRSRPLNHRVAPKALKIVLSTYHGTFVKLL